MPLYDYKCTRCNRTEEYLVQTVNQDPLECAHCGTIGSLERGAIQSFSIGGSEKSSKSPSSQLDKIMASHGYQKISFKIKVDTGKEKIVLRGYKPINSSNN